MGFNYGKEKLRFEAQWSKLEEEYRKAGFDEAGIEAMREYDWERFKERRINASHEQELPSESFDESDDNVCSSLFRKFASLSFLFDENALPGRFDWIEAIENQTLAGKLKNLCDADKELLTLYVYDGYTQEEIAVMQGCVHSTVSRNLSRIKKLLS